ncbi:MAG: hypothetical protein KAS91_02135, partial [Candidatus Pacebacteria bacterium]|nr:hypothetical protein [Candidatus Paceibacterota bacterium]
LIINNHPDVQPSLGAYGFVLQFYLIKEKPMQALRFFLISQYEHNFTNKEGFFSRRRYNFGNSVNISFFITKHLHMPPFLEWLSENWTAILQVRNEIKEKNKIQSINEQDGELVYDEWIEVKNSGSYVLFICPQLNYTLKKKLNISVMMDIPLYQYYNGIQLATDYAFSFNLTRDLSFKKK